MFNTGDYVRTAHGELGVVVAQWYTEDQQPSFTDVLLWGNNSGVVQSLDTMMLEPAQPPFKPSYERFAWGATVQVDGLGECFYLGEEKPEFCDTDHATGKLLSSRVFKLKTNKLHLTAPESVKLKGA